MTVEPCAYCGHTPTVSDKQKMICCKSCGFPWVQIDRWTETMKAVAHYRICDNREKKVTGIEEKTEVKW